MEKVVLAEERNKGLFSLFSAPQKNTKRRAEHSSGTKTRVVLHGRTRYRACICPSRRRGRTLVFHQGEKQLLHSWMGTIHIKTAPPMHYTLSAPKPTLQEKPRSSTRVLPPTEPVWEREIWAAVQSQPPSQGEDVDIAKNPAAVQQTLCCSCLCLCLHSPRSSSGSLGALALPPSPWWHPAATGA